MVDVFAPAKVNLTLHVTGQRDDGYHLLDSLVAFAPVCDEINVTPANTLSLTVEGPEAAGVPADMGNLALKVAALYADDTGAALTLLKRLPAAAGIGGGSADAAAAFRGIMALREDLDTLAAQSDEALRTRFAPLLGLGADILMCLGAMPARVQGIGDKLEVLSDFTPLPALLVNPRVPVSTPLVFKALRVKDNPPMPAQMPVTGDVADVAAWLATQRNDLQAPAIDVAPEIGTVLDVLAASDGCLLARMSGSGATCFALYPDAETGIAAGRKLRRDHPGWWVAGGLLGDQSELAAPRIN